MMTLQWFHICRQQLFFHIGLNWFVPLLRLSFFTEQEVGTWQSLPELDIDPGDFTSDTSNREGEDYLAEARNVDSHHNNIVTKRVTSSNQGQDMEI